MALKPDRERVKLLLKDTITLLCKNGLEFKNTFAVDAVIGVTLDESDVFLVSMNEIVKSDRYQEPSTTNKDGDISSQGGLKERRRKRRRKHSDIKSEFAGGSVAGSESSDLDNADHHEPHPKRYELESKQEPLSDNDENDEDIVVIKEELDDNWHESVQQQSGSRAEAQSSMFYGEQGTSADMSSQNQNFDDMSLLSTPGKNSCWALVPGNQGSGHMESFRSGGSRSSVSDCIERHPGDLSQDSGPQQFPYPCQTCGKVISSKSFWKRHVNWHKGQYPYHCTYCGKGCMSTSQLKGHLVVHTGQKEFHCEICRKEFSYNTHLYSHMRRVHNLEKTKHF